MCRKYSWHNKGLATISLWCQQLCHCGVQKACAAHVLSIVVAVVEVVEVMEVDEADKAVAAIEPVE